MSSSFRVLRVGDIDVLINWSWLLIFVWLTWSLGDFYATHFAWSSTEAYVVGAISAILLFVTVLLHELAHSFTARALGLPVHSITLFFFGGVSNLTREPDSPREELLVTVAGPLTSLLLAAIFFLIHAVLPGSLAVESAVTGYLATVNLVLGIFNLIPGFPLDGGRIFRSVVWMITGNMRRATRIASTLGQGIGYVFVLVGILEAVATGDVIGGLTLVFVGWFLQNAASATYQQAVLENVLRGVEVRDVMDAPPPAVSRITPLEEVVFTHIMHGNQRAVPVVDPDGSLRGLVTLGDVRAVPREEWENRQVWEAMTPAQQLRTVHPDDDLRDALRVLAENSYHQLPVVQERKLIGMLNRAHVLQYVHLRRILGPRPLPGSAEEAEELASQSQSDDGARPVA